MKPIVALIGIFFTLQVFAYTPISDDRLNELLEGFKYRPQVEIQKWPKAGCTPEDFEFTTTYPQRNTPLPIQAKAFIPVGQKAPVVFMLPPLNGMNQLDQNMAIVLCKQNIAAIVIRTNLTGLGTDELMPVSDHDHTLRRTVSAIKGGLLAIQKLSEINTEKVGLFGVSLGGILGSVAYGVMPEISAATLIVNGGDVPHIMAYSDQGTIVKIRTARMKEQGMATFEEYEHYLRQNLELDPLHFSKLIDADSTKMFLSKADLSVPSEKQLEYYRSIGSPRETVFYSLDHIKTIVAVLGIGNHKPKIADWFKARFALPNPRLH